jgi:hypothetical protein
MERCNISYERQENDINFDNFINDTGNKFKTFKYIPGAIELDENKMNSQEIFLILGIKIYFPYPPYESQKKYMESGMLYFTQSSNQILFDRKLCFD